MPEKLEPPAQRCQTGFYIAEPLGLTDPAENDVIFHPGPRRQSDRTRWTETD